MNAVTENSAPPAGWWPWLRCELAPFPGRGVRTLRMVATVVIVTIISMAWQTPETAVSAYMVFFVSKENPALTLRTGIGLLVGATLGVGLSLLLYRFTFDYAELRIPVMAATIFFGMFLSRVSVIGPLGFAIGFIVALTQSMAESAPDADALVRALLWTWVFVVFPGVLTVMVSQTLMPDVKSHRPPAHGGGKNKHGLFVADAFTNPDYPRFALKVTLAAMSCYVIYMGVDWPGIHTAFITCCFIALESTTATIRKGWLRLAGCLVGGTLGFLSILFLIPHMESILSLALLAAAGAALAGWVAAGGERIAYAGLQIALAFFMCIFQGFGPEVNFTTIRDRLVGIILGLAVSSAIFLYLWPERGAGRP
ncbi:MAG: FUSC family protein [Verrucomicrobiae bacterium]|nr:FUSC family protein [Verrucomicrobiae bacterium]